MTDTKRSPEEILEAVRAIAEKASPGPWAAVGNKAVRNRLGDGEYSVLALFERISWKSYKKLPRKANTQLAALAPTVAPLLEAVVAVQTGTMYSASSLEQAEKLNTALAAVDAALGAPDA